MAFRLMAMLVLSPPREILPKQLQLASLISDSLGDPAYYNTGVDKTLLPPAAENLGVRVPQYAVVRGMAAAEAFATTHGYPVVLNGLPFTLACTAPYPCRGPISTKARKASPAGFPRRGCVIQQGCVHNAGVALTSSRRARSRAPGRSHRGGPTPGAGIRCQE